MQNDMNDLDQSMQAAKEMLEYVKDKPGISYNDLKAYAYDNDKETWIAALRKKNIRMMIAFCLRDKRIHDDVPYNNSLSASLLAHAEARDKYRERNGKSTWS